MSSRCPLMDKCSVHMSRIMSRPELVPSPLMTGEGSGNGTVGIPCSWMNLRSTNESLQPLSISALVWTKIERSMLVMPTCISNCRPCFRVIRRFVFLCFGADFGVITGDLFDTMVHVFGVESDTRSPGVATLCPGRTAFTAGLRQNANQKTWTCSWSIPCSTMQVPPSLRRKDMKTWP